MVEVEARVTSGDCLPSVLQRAGLARRVVPVQRVVLVRRAVLELHVVLVLRREVLRARPEQPRAVGLPVRCGSRVQHVRPEPHVLQVQSV